MPFYHSKLGATPVPPPPQYLELQFQIPLARTLDQALKNIAYLSDLKATGQIDVASADSLINDNRTIANALVDEAKILAAQGQGPEPLIRIEGGLPRLLGTDIIMPGDLTAQDWGWTESVYSQLYLNVADKNTVQRNADGHITTPENEQQFYKKRSLLARPHANGIAITDSVAFHLWAEPKIKRERSSATDNVDDEKKQKESREQANGYDVSAPGLGQPR
jgi:hypothetical protein